MLRNHLKIALRNLRKHKGYALINVTGLAVGLACCLAIALYVQHELSYARFHVKADRIYRVVQEQRFSGTAHQVAVVAAPVGPALKDDYPEVQHTVRFAFRNQVVRYEDGVSSDNRIAVADSNVFEVFTFSLIKGNSSTALAQPNTLVRTEDMTHKYFGKEDPIGKTLRVEDGDYVVTGVMANVPANAHFDFDALTSFSTLSDIPWLDNWGVNSGNMEREI